MDRCANSSTLSSQARFDTFRPGASHAAATNCSRSSVVIAAGVGNARSIWMNAVRRDVRQYRANSGQ